MNLASSFTPVPIYHSSILGTGPLITVLSEPQVSFLHLVLRTHGKGMLHLEHQLVNRMSWPCVDEWSYWLQTPSQFCTDISAACHQLLNGAANRVIVQDKLSSVRLLSYAMSCEAAVQELLARRSDIIAERLRQAMMSRNFCMHCSGRPCLTLLSHLICIQSY